MTFSNSFNKVKGLNTILYLQDIPIDECMIYMITHAWLRMAEIVRSPFDGDKYYDIDIVRRIDSELFEASAALHL